MLVSTATCSIAAVCTGKASAAFTSCFPLPQPLRIRSPPAKMPARNYLRVFIVPPELVSIRPLRTSKPPVRVDVRHRLTPDSFVIAERPSTARLRGRKQTDARANLHGRPAVKECLPLLAELPRCTAGALVRLPHGFCGRELPQRHAPAWLCGASRSVPASCGPNRTPPSQATRLRVATFCGRAF